MTRVLHTDRYRPNDAIAIPKELARALPETRAGYIDLRNTARAAGIEWDVAPYGGVRSEADTSLILGYRDADWKAAVARDPTLPNRTSKTAWRKIAPFGRSMHNYGAAIDVEIVAVPDSWSATEGMTFVLNNAVLDGWNDGRDFGDTGHIEIDFRVPPGSKAVASARNRWKEEGSGTVTQSVTDKLGDVARGVTGTSGFSGVDLFALLALVAGVLAFTVFHFRRR